MYTPPKTLLLFGRISFFICFWCLWLGKVYTGSKWIRFADADVLHNLCPTHK